MSQNTELFILQISKETSDLSSESFLVSPNNKVYRMCLTIMLWVVCFMVIHQGLCPATLMENGFMNQLHPLYGIYICLYSASLVN